ncbi:MAG: glutamate cyclase domain-containing protein [Hyphomicrobiales bacterium]
MKTTEKQLANIGRNIDRLVTVEARISDLSRGVIAKLYEAACEAQGGGPLSMLAARQIMDTLEPGKVVFLITGAGDPQFLPAGETDGPPGLAALALAIHTATGAVPMLFTDEPYVANVEATTLACGLGIRDAALLAKTPFTTTVLPIAHGDAAEPQAKAYVERFSPAMMISIEKLGPNSEGVACSSTGTPTTPLRGRGECLFDEAKRAKIPTLGIGDNGNELGFGLILDAVRKHKPNGERVGTRVSADVLVAAITSTRGAYGVEAALAAMLGRPEIMHGVETERRMLEACVRANGVDGSTGRHIMAVDGMPAEVQYAIVEMLGCIVRNGTLSGFKRGF